MSTLKLENIKHENSSTNNMVMNSNGAVSVTNNATVGGTLGITGATTASGTLTSTGLITASSGVAIGGTGAANTLDDYEEGTFTPFLNALSQNPSYSSQVGRYTKVGRVCTVYIRIYTTTFNGGTGNISIGGLPFTQTSGPYAVGSFFGLFGWEDYDNIVPQFSTNANTIELYEFVKYAGSNYIVINNTHLHNNGGAAFMFTIQATYEVQ